MISIPSKKREPYQLNNLRVHTGYRKCALCGSRELIRNHRGPSCLRFAQRRDFKNQLIGNAQLGQHEGIVERNFMEAIITS